MYKNLSVQALGISGGEREIIELALSHGFKGVDLDLQELTQQVAAQGLAKATRLLTSSRLKFGSFPLPVAWDDDEQYRADMERLPQWGELAQELGCSRAVVTIDPGHDRRPYHENFEFHRKRLNEIADALATYKIRLGLGYLAPMSCRSGRAFQFIQSFDEVLLLLRTINSPTLGVTLDTWHWHLSGGTLEGLRAVPADKIVSVTLADAEFDTTAATATLETRKVPGEEGAIDIPAVLTAIAETGYDGPVTPAPDRSQFPAQGREAIVKKLGASLDQVWKLAGLTAGGKLAAVPGR